MHHPRGRLLRHAEPMASAPHSPLPVQLTTARPAADGDHTGTRLGRAARRGELVRLHRGVYADAERWSEAPPWERSTIATVAAAHRTPAPVFCREAALLLHGVSLLDPPRDVPVRTRRAPEAGRRRPAATPRRDMPPAHPLRHHEAPLPLGMSRPELRDALARGDRALDETILPPDAVPWCPGPEAGFRVEPLPLALLDTIPRMSRPAAVAALDSVARGTRLVTGPVHEDELLAWDGFPRTTKARRRWESCWAFADAAAESVGESVSRVRMDQWGLEPPQLQVRCDVDLDGGSRVRVDFFWPEHGIVGEFDGLTKYQKPELLAGRRPEDVVVEEKLREDALRRLGLRVVRWVWADLRRPSRLRDLLVAAGVPRSR